VANTLALTVLILRPPPIRPYTQQTENNRRADRMLHEIGIAKGAGAAPPRPNHLRIIPATAISNMDVV